MTLGELRENIVHYVENEDEPTFDGMVDTFIVMAEDLIHGSGLIPASLQEDTTALSIGTPAYTVPAGLLRPMSFSVVVAGAKRPVVLKDESFLKAAFPTAPSGVPRYYARKNETSFALSHSPDLAYGVSLQYYGYPASITADAAGDAATSWLSLYAPTALLYGSVLQAYLFLKGEADLMAKYEGEYNKAMALLKNTVDGFATMETQRHDVVRNQPQ